MLKYNDCQEIIRKQLNKLKFNSNPRELYDPIHYILSLGGKRIRPVLLMMSCNLFSDFIEKSINPAIGVELFHNFTLIHDDLIDNSDLRRSQPTVHIKWDPSTAILSGDAMLIKAYDYLFDVDPVHLNRVFQVFNKTALEVCEGQQYDILYENSNDVSIDNYLNMIRLKTAVLIACAVKIGGILGNADDNDSKLLYEFGEKIGIAFQLQDDLLDVYGDSKKFGKNIGGDIILNKKTYLLINTLNNSDESIKNELLNWINKKEFNKAEKINAIIQIYNSLNIKVLTINKINEYFNTAYNCLKKISVSEKRKTILKDLIISIENRIS